MSSRMKVAGEAVGQAPIEAGRACPHRTRRAEGVAGSGFNAALMDEFVAILVCVRWGGQKMHVKRWMRCYVAIRDRSCRRRRAPRTHSCVHVPPAAEPAMWTPPFAFGKLGFGGLATAARRRPVRAGCEVAWGVSERLISIATANGPGSTTRA
jgi:hypothetical protein